MSRDVNEVLSVPFSKFYVAVARKVEGACGLTPDDLPDVDFRGFYPGEKATIGDYRITAEYGLADEPGRWDHWPSGFVARLPNEGSANGVVVLSPGDQILPFKTYVQSPVRLEIRDGFIRDIQGGLDADYLRAYMTSFKDPEAFAVSLLGWGLQPRAQWTSLGMYEKDASIGMDGRAFYGNFLFSTGPGGPRRTPCHLDIPMRNCSFYVDNAPMVIDGDVIPDDQRVAS